MLNSPRASQSETQPNLVIYGNGAMAATFASYLEHSYNLVAFTVDRDFVVEPHYLDKPLVPFDELHSVYPPESHSVLVAVGYVQMNRLRDQITQRLVTLGYSLAQFIAPDLWLHKRVKIGDHCVILDHCSIHAGSSVGDNCFLSSGVNVGHDCCIGSNAWINSGVALAGNVQVGDNCFLGVNSSVAHGVTLAPGTYVGANTLVTTSTENNNVVISRSGEVYPVNSEVYLALLNAGGVGQSGNHVQEGNRVQEGDNG
jgi:sugar O-acyltransferase (sialic acid O-acetyltransferase NeuD family)